eukprot:TRINITY_DN786_c0_g1_i5.p1 TRINITY_DN786_c0_g1~~TRINITY_DN786_c0_g1_i5.p1  ORF type:complete len:1335 (+),score=441.92 TRINITY_DN786_c0_g1_i5:243-4007(+)
MGNIINSFSPSLVITPGHNITIIDSSSTSEIITTPPTATVKFNDFTSSLNFSMSALGVMAAIGFVCSFFYTTFLGITAQNQATHIRHEYFKCAISQEIAWYDSKKAGEITERFGGDIETIQGGLGNKFGMIFQCLCMFVGGWIVGFTNGWRLAIIILAVMPFIVVTAGLLGKLMQGATKKAQQSYAKAGGIAEEVLASMRTVTALNNQNQSLSRYVVHLDESYKVGVKKNITVAICIGILMLALFSTYGLAFWYGAVLIRDDVMNAGKVLTVFFAIMMGSMGLAQATPNLTAFGEARGAAYEIYEVISRKSEIDPYDTTGEKLELTGNIEFENISFFYPTRPTVKVLDGISFSLHQGQTMALVGPSGCGKSTTVGLIERFYNPESGTIKLDGKEIQTLNLAKLREQIGIVGQEPVLFALTIKENIKIGANSDISDEEIFEACKMANIHEFITTQPKGYDTLVGERGVQLSGGQKQRIAIARALVRKPKILLLDEATSALDTESEAIVQDALEKASKGRTTIIIAHRLSTVKNSDIILTFQGGKIIERGNHKELMENRGLYYTLVSRQELKQLRQSGKPAPVKAKAPISTLEDEQLLPDSDSSTTPGFGITPPPGVVSVSPAVSPLTSPSVTPVPALDDNDIPLINPLLEKESKREPLLRTFKFIKPNAHLLIFGSIVALMNGAVMPIFALVFTKVLTLLMQVGVGTQEFQDDTNKKIDLWCMGFFLIAGGVGILQFCERLLLGIGGERLTRIVRTVSLKAMMRQNIGFFDDKKNSTGVLTTRLATDATLIDSATGSRVGTSIQMVGSIAAGLIVGFTGSWRMALIILACVPVLMVSQFINLRFLVSSQAMLKESYEQSGIVASEAVENIRTVAMLGREEYFKQRFVKEIVEADKKSNRNSIISGVAAGIAGAFQFAINALCFYCTAKFIEDGSGDFQGTMQGQMGIMFGTMSVTQLSAVMPDFGKAKLAAKHFFELLDRLPSIDSEKESGLKDIEIRGEIDFEDIEFVYPTRRSTVVLKGFNLSVKPGQTVALVGPSGCGKSTTVGMVERFYDPVAGLVKIDGRDIHEYNIKWLRSQIGIVSQEPTLFGMTIRENIAMGLGEREISMEKIVAAAKQANAHNFIMKLPDQYETQVGEKGTQLSGGQKQRIAIARALVSNPKILLLDEATSALDTESEAVVQEALDNASKGRTTIVIAHRLSTVQKADAIAVLKKGRVIELGTHQQLFSDTESQYYKLASKQAMEIPMMSKMQKGK